MTDLEPHRESADQHYDRNDILHDDNDFAIDGLGLEPERSPDDFNRLGTLYEQCRNSKIDALGMEYGKTDYFGAGDNAKMVLEKLRAYIAPPVVEEPEPEMIYMGLYYITGYDTCYACCGKTDGITASGTYATAGRTVAASSKFNFGTRLYIDGLGKRVVEDRGGAIGGGRLDVVCEDHAECYAITGWYDVWLIMEG